MSCKITLDGAKRRFSASTLGGTSRLALSCVLLSAYVDRFNARDFDAVRDMLAEEVRLELVNRTRLNGRREVSNYFTNYSRVTDWWLVTGMVDRRPAILVCDPQDSRRRPIYFVLLQWKENGLATIRDFRHARYAPDGAEVIALE